MRHRTFLALTETTKDMSLCIRCLQTTHNRMQLRLVKNEMTNKVVSTSGKN